MTDFRGPKVSYPKIMTLRRNSYQAIFSSAFGLVVLASACFYPRVQGVRSTIRLWCPVVLWMMLIFAGSTDLLSSQRTSRIIGPLLRFFVPSVTDDTVLFVQMGVRKAGHLTEYAILAALACRAFSGSEASAGTMSLGAAGTSATWRAWLLSTLYAATDEFHQSFVSPRHGSPWDCLVDSFGAFAGLCLVRWRARVLASKRAARPAIAAH